MTSHLRFLHQQTQSSQKTTGPKTEASEFEVRPVKIENQEVQLAFGFYQTFYEWIYFN
jgi:hypothetical protein